MIKEDNKQEYFDIVLNLKVAVANYCLVSFLPGLDAFFDVSRDKNPLGLSETSAK